MTDDPLAARLQHDDDLLTKRGLRRTARASTVTLVAARLHADLEAAELSDAQRRAVVQVLMTLVNMMEK